MSSKTLAEVTTVIHEPVDRVWQALVDPKLISQYMMGAEVITDWEEGSTIRWKGEWQGKPYEDRGHLLIVREPDLLKYTHVSSAAPDKAHTITVELIEVAGVTHLHLTQDNNVSQEACIAAEKNWRAILDGLKKVLGEAPVKAPKEART